MADIIVAFPKLDDAKKLRRLLIRNGYDVIRVCDSGAEIIDAVQSLDGGIVISAYHFSDMYYFELNDYLPKGFQLLLLASPGKLAEVDTRDLMALPMPFKMQDLFSTIDMMLMQYRRWKKKQKHKPKAKTEQDKKIIQKAKELLIDRNNMTEDEAHRYIQKNSMNSGISMAESAELILELKGKEWNL